MRLGHIQGVHCHWYRQAYFICAYI